MKNSLVFIFLFLIIASCTDKFETEGGKPSEETPVFSLKINGNSWTPTEYYYDIKDEGVSIIYATDKVYTFSWIFDSELKEKKYVLGSEENQLITSMYKRVDSQSQTYSILNGELNIIKFDPDNQILKCAFSFSAKHNEESVEIKDGKIFINMFK